MIPYSSHFYNHIDRSVRYRGTVSLLVLLYNWKWLISSYDLTILISILWFLILLFGAKRVKLFSRPSVIIAISLFCTKHHNVTDTSPATQHLLLSNWKSFLSMEQLVVQHIREMVSMTIWLTPYEVSKYTYIELECAIRQEYIIFVDATHFCVLAGTCLIIYVRDIVTHTFLHCFWTKVYNDSYITKYIFK